MADRRYIAQQITDSGQVAQLIASCGPWAGLLFSWAIAHVDDDGRLVGTPDQVRHKILGRYLDLVDEDQVAEALATMNDLELVVWYEVIGAPLERYLYFPKFSLHQTLRTDRYGPSRFPPPPGWQPDEGHPYVKNPNLVREKPQRDRRQTRRVAKRPVYKGQQLALATAGRPPGASLATAAQPLADDRAQNGDEASRHPTSPLLSSPHVTPPLTAADSGPVSADTRSVDRDHEDCHRESCEHAWLVHASGFTKGTWQGATDALGFHDCLTCYRAGKICEGYVEHAPAIATARVAEPVEES